MHPVMHATLACKLSSEPLIFLYTIIFTINYSVLPQLLLQKLCLRRISSNVTDCKQVDSLPDDLHKEATSWWFYLLLCSLLPTVFTVLVWGPVTDIIGRKRAMLAVPVINGIRALVYLLNSYILTAHPAFLIFGSFLSCLYGEFQGVVALCYAYMADVTVDKIEQRTMRMAFVEASLFLSGVPAGLLSGYLLEAIGFVSVFVLTCGINVIMFLYVVLWIPESRISDPFAGSKNEKVMSFSEHTIANSRNEKAMSPNEHANVIAPCLEGRNLDNMNSFQGLDVAHGIASYQNEHVTDHVSTMDHVTTLHVETCWKKLNPFTYLVKAFKTTMRTDNRHVLLPLLAAFGFTVCAVLGELIVQTLYLTHQPFAFMPKMIGYYSAIQSMIRGFGVVIFTQLSFHIFHLSDQVIVVVGLISAAVCYFLIGIVRSTILVFVVNITGFAIPAATTTLRSLATKQVSQGEYGSVLALLEALDALGGVGSNCVSLWMYGGTLGVYTGVVFFVLSGLALTALLITVVTFYSNCIK